MNEQEIMEKARQLRAAGVPIAEIERYVQAKMAALQPADDTAEVEAGYPERFATTVLQGAQVIPGMKAFQAAMGSLGSKFTDNPVSYADAKAGLEEQTERMGTGRQLLSQAVSAPVMAPVAAMRGLSALSPAMQGAAYGGASAALDFNPDESLEGRLLRTGVGATAGAVLGKAGSGAAKLAKAPSGTVKKVLKDALVPTKWQRAARSFSEATEVPAVVKPQIRLNQASAPKAEGFIGNSIDNLLDAAKHVDNGPMSSGAPQTLESRIGDIVQNASPFKQRSAPKARFEHFAERMAQRQAAEAEQAAEPALEDLLALSLEHIKQGGSLRQASDVASKLKIARSPK